MTEDTARALARRRVSAKGPALAAIDAALIVGGYDPDRIEPDNPQGYNERACSDARAWNPAYLSDAELSAWQEAWERTLDGQPF